MMNPFANALAGGIGAGIGVGAIGGEAAHTLSMSSFANVFATQAQAQQFHNTYAQQIEQLAQANITRISMPGNPKPMKEAPKIELNPKRAVQLEE